MCRGFRIVRFRGMGFGKPVQRASGGVQVSWAGYPLSQAQRLLLLVFLSLSCCFVEAFAAEAWSAPSGAKAPLHRGELMAGLKPRPFKAGTMRGGSGGLRLTNGP
jgi:hypothetical protein